MEPITFTEVLGAFMASGATLLGGHHLFEARRRKNERETWSDGVDPAVRALHRRMDELGDKIAGVRTLQEQLNDSQMGPQAIDPSTGTARSWCQARTLTPEIERLSVAIQELPERIAAAVKEH